MWTKRKSEIHDIVSYVELCSGELFNDFLQNKTYRTNGLDDIAKILREYAIAQKPIKVVSDYDTDGVASSYIICSVLKKLGAKYSITIPKRESEGYGLSEIIINRIKEPGSLLLTVDNGIAAAETIAIAKEAGMQVVILDHHNSDGTLPNADIIVDPEVISDGWDFIHYCASGLSYLLAREMFPDDEPFLQECLKACCLATIADVVPLLGENRQFVLDGLALLNNKKGLKKIGADELIRYIGELKKVSHWTVDDIAFKVTPCINAMSRMSDEGANEALKCFFATTESQSAIKADLLYTTNESRKEIVDNYKATMQPKGVNVKFIYDDMKEGICGILAGQLCDEYNQPAFVMTKGSNGLIKGSGRSVPNIDIYDVLSKCTVLEKYGGHDQAAGFQLKEENVDTFLSQLDNLCPANSGEKIDYYDIEANISDFYNMYNVIRQVDVWGAGIQNPVIKVELNIVNHDYIGKDKVHLRVNTVEGIKGIGFSLAEKYESMGCPNKITAYGNIQPNYYNSTVTPQLQIIDIE